MADNLESGLADNFSRRIISQNATWRIISQYRVVADNLAFYDGGAAKTPMSRPNWIFGLFLCPIYFSTTLCKPDSRDFTMQQSRFEHTIVHLLQRVFGPRFCDGDRFNSAQIAVRTEHCPSWLADNLAFCDGDAVKMWMSPPKCGFRTFLSPISFLLVQPR